VKRFASTSTFAVGLLAGSTALLPACGGDERPTAEPEVVLEEASVAASAIRSGEIDAQVDLDISAAKLSQSAGLRLEGPFRGQPGGTPQFDFDATLTEGSASGSSDTDFGLIAAADRAYFESGEKVYDVAPAAFKRYESLFNGTRGGEGGEGRGSAPGLNPASWFIDPSNEGTESIGDVEVVHVSGTADVEQLASDLSVFAAPLGLLQASELRGIGQTFDDATIDLYAGVEDRVPRRVELELRWNGRLEGGEPFQGVLGGSINLGEINQPQEIESPDTAHPLRGSVEDLPPQLSGLGEFLSFRLR